MTDEVDGTPFGRYRLVDLLGRGGMGEVWRAYDPVNARFVALKVLPGNFAGDPVFQERFRREARAAARLDEPHVVPIYDSGEIDGHLFVSMRLVRGHDLAELLGAGPLPPGRIVSIVEQIAFALDAAHQVGLVHRDVKPSNILVGDNDFAYLIDFGIARAAGESGLTSTGSTIGTWAYMAPERFERGGAADARADIYALACVLHQGLTGQPPFPAEAIEQIAVAHMVEPPPKPSALRAGVPAAMDEVVATGMAKDPAQRYASTLELVGAARVALDAGAVRPAPAPPRPAPAPVPQRPVPTDPADAVTVAGGRRLPARPARGRRTPLVLAAVGVAVAVVIGAVIFGVLNRDVASRPAPSTQAAPATQTTPSYSQTVLPFTGLDFPARVAVDGDGVVYVVDQNNNRVVKLVAGAQSELPFTGLNYPNGVAVDSAGAVYVADAQNSRAVKVVAGGQTALPFTGLVDPSGIAVDGSGAVYLADPWRGVFKLVAGAQSVLPFTGLDRPCGVAVDGSGAIYVTDVKTNRVVKLSPR